VRLVHAVCLTAGFAAALGAAAAVLWSQGILSEALYWTIGDHDVPHVFWRRALEHTGGFVAVDRAP
jgi:hypothetical protein